jgi:tRNA threonylcarbamoyladenosine biosynthesis protein TsaB
LSPSEPPRLLVIETSARAGVVALASGAQLVAVQHLDEARRHARDLAPAAAGLLAERGWAPRDLAGVVVGLGPGSYTGLRVGVMSAKAFAYATGCALLGVGSFAAVALQAPDEAARVDVLADAQQDKVYAQPFDRSADGWQPAAPLAVVPFAAWLACRGDAWATGPGLRRWAAHVPGAERVAPEDCWDPRPESLLRLGLARHLAGERDDVYALEPLYLRPSSAEERWQGRGPRGGRAGDCP